jgi:transposase
MSNTRAIADLSSIHTPQNNRAQAAAASQALPALVVKEMQHHQKYLEQRMTQLRRQALRLVAEDTELDRRFRLMLTATGIGETSALQILGELAVLPGTLDCPSMGRLQWAGSTAFQVGEIGRKAAQNQSRR